MPAVLIWVGGFAVAGLVANNVGSKFAATTGEAMKTGVIVGAAAWATVGVAKAVIKR